ncbi:helix-turn-helix domain-containing protein [Streptomyces kunmingensis]|uniref:Helix-turn-helix domain-containing protein n=1 Tax=Streptomyces kunmingensis TaxID=68225 RepID=A0ABU6CN41_9ACTN|nr:helix-turn-helix domain-containing protein [Streptomyces kunmingensis]MEB3966144.1 helix-turn-helix domain-containing protein [Streptomyces kunmingensis]
MSAQDNGDGVDEVAGFAALLRALKERTDRSYGSLARRLGMNTSTLHRYCAGDAVPLDFAPVERFAALCGATSEQRLELHRRWLLAVAARRRPRTVEAAGPAGPAESAPDAAAAEEVNDAAGVSGPVAEGVTETGTASKADGGSVSTPADTAPKATVSPVVGTDAAFRPPGPLSPPRRPWYRRRRLAVGLASVCGVLAMLGAFSALPDDERRASVDGPDRVAGTAEAHPPEGRGASLSPSAIPTSTSQRPSGSPTPKKKPRTSRPPGATSAPPRNEQRAELPLAWSVNSQAWKLGCGHDYVIAKPPSQVPPPPAPQDAAPWAATQSAVHGGETLVQLSVQGRSDTAVVLEALRVRVVGRTTPAEGNAYAMDHGCGGALTPRYFAVDLDKDRPLARAVAGNDSGTPIPAVRMPYRVSAEDPEVLLVTAGTSSCDCRWYLELDWSSQGRKGTVRIDDDGRPFRTSSIKGLPRYVYDTLDRRWGPYS